ncbi:hypothetical protein [Burkholderia multivorans]|uniref:hypothetical protein n=1 Tax=Burkholderia multivorans TaxID=87883 RepID=UPI0035104E1A
MKNNNKISQKLPVNLDPLEDIQLLELRAAIDAEARKRGLSFNVDEIGEKLAISLFKERPDLPVLAPAPRGTKKARQRSVRHETGHTRETPAGCTRERRAIAVSR